MKLWEKGLLLGAAAVPFCLWQNNVLTVSQVALGSPALPRGFDGFRILQISDLHGRRFGAEQRILLQRTFELAPDMIVITGDLVDRRQTNAAPALEYIHGVGVPVGYIPGNHEASPGVYDWLRPQLLAAGVTILDDGVDFLERNGDRLALLGVRDWSFHPENFTDAMADKQFRRRLEDARERAGDDFSVLLTHRPEKAALYQELGFDAVLCGHAHGGQVRLPGIGGIFAPGQGLFPSYTAGLYRLGRTSMVVSRGLGSSSHAPQRIFNRPELMLVTLRRTARLSVH